MYTEKIKQMRVSAGYAGKTIPTPDELLAMIVATGMICPICKREMTLHAMHRKLAGVITLQHDKDGTMRCICHSCNSRERDLPAGVRLEDCPVGHKYCRECGVFKPLSDFANTGGRPYRCRECRNTVKRTLALLLKEATNVGP